MYHHYTADIDKCLPTGQHFVVKLCQDTLDTVRVNHEQKTSYIDVDLRNQANMEFSTVRDYRGRYIFELLQNANDAILATEEEPTWKRPDGYRVLIELTPDALIVANDGVPFLEKDVDSIFRWGESSKDPNKSIGYKGIGFKSILEITESPQIFSQVVQFWFDRATCFREIQNIIGETVDLRLPITRFIFPYPLDQLDSDDHAQNDRLLNRRGYATVMRFPLKEKQNVQTIREQIIQELEPALLLFLKGIDRIEFRAKGRRPKLIAKSVVEHENYAGREIILNEGPNSQSRWLLFEAPKVRIADRELLTELQDNAWERIRKVGFAIALPLDKLGKLDPANKQTSRLHVYFPTDVVTGLRFRIHGDFHMDSARKNVGKLNYNVWLTRKIAAYIASAVVPELLQRYDQDGSVLRIFVPDETPQGFSKVLYDHICEELRDCRFIPSIDGPYIAPKDCLLAPRGTWSNLDSFRRFFQPVQFNKFHQGKTFPADTVYEYGESPQFLKSLGATQLSYSDAFRLLRSGPQFSEPAASTAFYEFLWTWREKVAYDEREKFSFLLSKTRLVLNLDGKWIKSNDRLYHAKLRLETPSMPGCVKADLVHPEAYGTGGREGSTYKLLSTLSPKIRDYDAPDIIRNGVMPLFVGNRFKKLSVDNRAEVYRYLFEYWSTMRGGDADVERLKQYIKVPARLVSNRRRVHWLTADEVYLSSTWSRDRRLESLFKEIEYIFFLYQVPGISPESEDVDQWAQFWKWMGVSDVPRLREHMIARGMLRKINWERLESSQHPHSGTQQWQEYLQLIRAKYGNCQKHGTGERLLQRSVSLEGFADLVERGDTKRLTLLFEILAENWRKYNTDMLKRAMVHCRERSYCNVAFRREQVPTFFEYLLKYARWMPAHTAVDGRLEAQLHAPTDCWFVSASEDSTLRNLLPTPITSSIKIKNRQFFNAIGLRFFDEASLDDLTDILDALPERYPDPSIPVRIGRRTNSRAISRLTRLVISKMDNLLQQSDQYDEAPPLPIVVTDNGRQRYANTRGAVFFADDRYQSPRWRQRLPFAPLDINMRDAAKYLGLHFLAQNVEDRPVPGNICEDESRKLQRRFVYARPYLLALVNDQRAAATQEIAGLLTILEIEVRRSLAVERTLTVEPGISIVDDKTPAYLMEESGERIGSAGRAPRQGTLLVHKDYRKNFDVLGAPLANYLRIPGLADAFVILLSRGSKPKRLQYLATRGITEVQVEEMRTLLKQKGVPVDELDDEFDRDLDKQLLNQIARNEDRLRGEKGSANEGRPADLRGTDSAATTELLTLGNLPPRTLEAIEFPDFDFASVEFNLVDADQMASIPERDTAGRYIKRGEGRKRQPDWEKDNRLKDAYGKRGEELVKLMEIKRLRKLGISEPEDYVRWLREEGYEVADHDLESIDLIDGEYHDIWIEVKSTPGTDFRVHMSRNELACAQREGDYYKLYRVIEVHSPVPKVYVFDNPYLMWQKDLVRIEPSDTYVVLPNPTVGY